MPAPVNCATRSRTHAIAFFEITSTRGMLLMQHPASAALARDSDEPFAIRAGRIDFMIDERLGRVSDSIPRAPHSLRHLGFLFMPTCAGTETLVERPHLLNRVRTESHVRAKYASHLDHFVTMIGDRQVEVRRRRPDFLIGIFGGKDSALHRGELAMRIEEILNRLEIAQRDDQIVIEKNQDLAGRRRDCAILDTAFPGARFVQMLERRTFERQLHRRRRAILCND